MITAKIALLIKVNGKNIIKTPLFVFRFSILEVEHRL